MCVCASVGADCVSSRGDRAHSEAGISDLALFGRHNLCVSVCVCAYMFVLVLIRKIFPSKDCWAMFNPAITVSKKYNNSIGPGDWYNHKDQPEGALHSSFESFQNFLITKLYHRDIHCSTLVHCCLFQMATLP